MAICLSLCLFASDPSYSTLSSKPVLDSLIQRKIESDLKNYLLEDSELFHQHQFRETLTELYKSHDYHLIWTSTALRGSLIHTLSRAYEEGLDPEHYSVRKLVHLFSKRHPSSITQIRTDLKATESLIKLLSHLYYGKVDPTTLHPSFDPNRDEELADLVPRIKEAIQNNQLQDLVNSITPTHESYTALKENLAFLRSRQKNGGWAPVKTSNKYIKPGETEASIANIRKRLGAVTPDSDTASENQYDEALVTRVKQFQQQHQLDADGIIGPKTVAALNIPLEEKIAKIRANLERMRWVFRDLNNDYILVDIAGFEIHLYQDSKRVWTARAQVGKPFRETPVFKSQIEYLEWNPDWTVPPTVIKEDLLPKLKNNPDYITEHDFQLLDHKNRPLPMSAVSWKDISDKYIPFKLRQPPGPGNALGRVKFIFPNPHYVYLHDTPSKNLFDSEERAFSSGCIRIENPYELAEILLTQSPEQSPVRVSQSKNIARILDGNKPERQYLPAPVPILLLYRTAQVTDTGMLKFSPDIYQRDKQLIFALDQETSSI